MKNYEAVVGSQSIKEVNIWRSEDDVALIRLREIFLLSLSFLTTFAQLDSDVLVELIRLQTSAGREAIGQVKSPRKLSDLNEFEEIPGDSLRQDLLRLVGSSKYADVTFLVEVG